MKNLMWFIRESKKFMGYGEDISKFHFWLRFPKAYFIFIKVTK
jgi:hypothetical protein